MENEKMDGSCFIGFTDCACGVRGTAYRGNCRGGEDLSRADAVAESLESAGFEVERSGVFEGLDIETTRIKAVNGDDYLDICYHVPSADDMDEIVTYYTQNYKKYNLVSGTDVVYCYSSDSVEETAGLRE